MDALVTRQYYTVATLPPAQMFQGDHLSVLDLDASRAGAFGTIAVGNGTTRALVQSDGVNWRTASPLLGMAGTRSGNWEQIGQPSKVTVPVSTVSFTTLDPTKYNRYRIDFWGIAPASINDYLSLRTSPNNGLSWDNGVADYDSMYVFRDTFSSLQFDEFVGGVGSLHAGYLIPASINNFSAFGYIEIFAPDESAFSRISYELRHYNGARSLTSLSTGAIWRQNLASFNGVQFLFFSGDNFQTGATFLLSGALK